MAKSKPTTMNLADSVSTSSSTVNSPIASESPEILKAPCRTEWSSSGKLDARNSNHDAASRHPMKAFGVLFNGPVIPFGAMVEYHPVSAKDLSRLHQFGSKVIWTGDILVADIQELERWPI